MLSDFQFLSTASSAVSIPILPNFVFCKLKFNFFKFVKRFNMLWFFQNYEKLHTFRKYFTFCISLLRLRSPDPLFAPAQLAGIGHNQHPAKKLLRLETFYWYRLHSSFNNTRLSRNFAVPRFLSGHPFQIEYFFGSPIFFRQLYASSLCRTSFSAPPGFCSAFCLPLLLFRCILFLTFFCLRLHLSPPFSVLCGIFSFFLKP